ncbi:MAG: UDP-N-acetylmuramoyl-L-alanine--D-glutamate ligase [bacterium]|nr:UDP-N-acetylmuramoyl-L-alanine--D-glutamate ligase [bacterium]
MSESLRDQWDGKRVTVMGLGLHGGGLAVATWFLRHGACVTVTDLKTRKQLRPSVAALERVARERGSGTLAFVLGVHRVRDFRDTDLIIQNPGVPRESKFLAIARAANVLIENEASLFFKMVRGGAARPSEAPEERRRRGGAVRIVAVTGTRGKSTTTALIHAMLRQAGHSAFLAGNIRIPMFDVIDRVIAASKRGPVDVVLELSSWHCERLSRTTGSADIAVLTNLYPDHLNRYPSMRSYAAAKARLVRFQNPRAIVVANAEQPIVRAMAACSPGEVRWYAARAPRRTWSGFTTRDGDCVRTRHGRATVITPRALLHLPGAHNTMNLLAAAAAATACGVQPLDIRRALRTFRGLPGRLEVIARRRGVTYVNDTCATSPDGAIAALAAIGQQSNAAVRSLPLFQRGSGRGCVGSDASFRSSRGVKEERGWGIILIAGGTDKCLEFDAWAQEVARSVKAIVFLPGTATEKMKRALRPFMIHDSSFITRDAPSMRSAVRTARQMARPGDTVLLSPGAASFGLFQHEFDRGEQFAREVRHLRL